MDVDGQRHAPAALYTREDLVPIVQEAGWAPGSVWTGAENLASTGFRVATPTELSRPCAKLDVPTPTADSAPSLPRTL